LVTFVRSLTVAKVDSILQGAKILTWAACASRVCANTRSVAGPRRR
jgi:hypothetical protein